MKMILNSFNHIFFTISVNMVNPMEVTKTTRMQHFPNENKVNKNRLISMTYAQTIITLTLL